MTIIDNAVLNQADFVSIWSTGLQSAILSDGYAHDSKSYVEAFSFVKIASNTTLAHRSLAWVVPTDCRLLSVDLTVADGTVAVYTATISGQFLGPISLSLTGASGIVSATKALTYPTGDNYINLLSGDTINIVMANAGVAGTARTTVSLTLANAYTEV